MDRRTDALTAQHIRNAQAAKWRCNRQQLAGELLKRGVTVEATCWVPIGRAAA